MTGSGLTCSVSPRYLTGADVTIACSAYSPHASHYHTMSQSDIKFSLLFFSPPFLLSSHNCAVLMKIHNKEAREEQYPLTPCWGCSNSHNIPLPSPLRPGPLSPPLASIYSALAWSLVSDWECTGTMCTLEKIYRVPLITSNFSCVQKSIPINPNKQCQATRTVGKLMNCLY